MSWKFEDWKVSKRENKWSVLNPETNDATRIHPLENVVFCAIKSERCFESWKIFILTASHSIIIESCVNRLKTDFSRLFLFLQSKHKLNLSECSLQFVTTCFLPPLQLSLHKIFSHYRTTIHITKINFLLYSLSNKKKLFMFCVSHFERKLFHFCWMKNYSIHRDSSFYTETGLLMHYGRVESGLSLAAGVVELWSFMHFLEFHFKFIHKSCKVSFKKRLNVN